MMRKRVLSLLVVIAFVTVLLLSLNPAFAQTVTNADFDPDFLSVLQADYPEFFDSSGDVVPVAIEACTVLNVSGNDLTSLRGIKSFTSLQELDCSFNALTVLDLTGLDNLKSLDCNVNKLTTLNLTSLNNLESVTCNRNELTSINVTGLSKLQSLGCGTNKLPSLDLTGLSSLQWLFCDNNLLKELDVTSLGTLETLWCYNNQLAQLDVSGKTVLSDLRCENNRLTALDVSDSPDLAFLTCSENYLSSPDAVKGWQALNLVINSPEALNSGTFWFYNQKEPIATCTVSFIVDDITTTVVVEFGEKVTRPDDPVKQGFLFDRWRTGSATGPRYDFDLPVTSDLVLYGTWARIIPVPDSGW
jgi:Leucine-rich repeat (LRR) protein